VTLSHIPTGYRGTGGQGRRDWPRLVGMGAAGVGVGRAGTAGVGVGSSSICSERRGSLFDSPIYRKSVNRSWPIQAVQAGREERFDSMGHSSVSGFDGDRGGTTGR
jgi:hypothetical protein